METAVKRLYEGLFLIDSALAASQWDQMLEGIRKILDRADAEVVSMKKWDERKLAYEIRGKGRGTYILVYFHCDPSRISGIERDVHLSETILRVLILRTDRMRPEDIGKVTPADLHPEEPSADDAAAAEEEEYNEPLDEEDEQES